MAEKGIECISVKNSYSPNIEIEYGKTKIELISEIESPRLKIELGSHEILIIYVFFVYVRNVLVSQVLQRV